MKGDGVSPLVKCLQQRNNSSICLAWIFWVSCEDWKVFSSFGNWHVGHLHSCLFGVFPKDVSSQGFREDAMPRSSNPKYICTCFSVANPCLSFCLRILPAIQKHIVVYAHSSKTLQVWCRVRKPLSLSLGNLAIAHLLLKQAQGFCHHLSFVNILNMIAIF